MRSTVGWKNHGLNVQGVVRNSITATFRLEYCTAPQMIQYKDDYKYEDKILSTRTKKIFDLQA